MGAKCWPAVTVCGEAPGSGATVAYAAALASVAIHARHDSILMPLILLIAGADGIGPILPVPPGLRSGRRERLALLDDVGGEHLHGLVPHDLGVVDLAGGGPRPGPPLSQAPGLALGL